MLGSHTVKRPLPERLSQEIVELRQLLTDTTPRYATHRRAISLPASLSPWIAHFWNEIGWLEDFAHAGLLRPDDDGSSLTALFEEWRSIQERGAVWYEGVLTQLPARYRGVQIGDEHVTFVDETEDDEDPPLCVVYGPTTDAEETFVERLEHRYLTEVVNAIVESVRPLSCTTLVAALPTMEEVLPSLMPGSRRSGSVWLLATAPLAEPNAPVLYDVRAPSRAAFEAWCAGADIAVASLAR